MGSQRQAQQQKPHKVETRKPAPPVAALQTPAPAMTGLMTPQNLMALQRSAGNRVVQAVISPPAGPSRKPGKVQRLFTKDEFKTETDAGFLAGRGKTMKAIDVLLDEYHGLRKTGLHLKPGATQDRAVNILHELIENVDVWKVSHEGDKSRSKKRIPGLDKLRLDATAELKSLNEMRTEAQKFMGAEQKPVARTENKLKTEMEGSFSSVLSKLGPIIGSVAPASGDTGELEVGIKIPVEPSGVAYVGLRVKAQVERLQKQALKVRFELAVTAGGKIGTGVDIGGELGMFVEAQGLTPEKAMELVSYGVYRRIRESRVIPNEVANFIWGGSGTAVGWNRSEKWAAGVEKENFKAKTLAQGGGVNSSEEDAYVETGGLAGVKAKGGVGGVAELEGTAQFSTGKKYDRESVTKLKSAGLGKQSKLPATRGKTEIIGESTHHLELGFSAKGGPFGGALKVGLDWATEGRQGRAKLQALKVALEASASLPMNELVAQGVGGYLPPMISTVVMGIRKAAQDTAKDPSSTSQTVGSVVSATENGATAITQLAGVPKTAFIPKFEVGQPPPTFAAPVELKLSLLGTYDFAAKKFLFEVKLEYIKGIEVNAGVFEMKAKKGQRLLRVFYDGSGWSIG